MFRSHAEILLLFSVIFLSQRSGCYGSYDAVRIVNNSYQGIVIAINPSIPENPTLLQAIQDVWTDASSVLYRATKKRVYFGQITILVPKTWNGTQYGKATTETYDKADVLVDEADNNKNEPFTIQTAAQCGDPGINIHLTPDYLISDEFYEDFGPKGKTIVHEWAHLRWGVFDEVATSGYKKFYLNSTGGVSATKCPSSLEGSLREFDNKLASWGECSFDNKSFLPTSDNCEFFRYPSDEQRAEISTSLMSQQFLDLVHFFCHDDPNDPLNQHNTEAPNEQNRFCNGRSTWSVIMSSPDFANGANSPNLHISDTTPVFKIVRPHLSRRYVLVLDISGSMRGPRLTKMNQTVSLFIDEFVSDGNRVGIVTFSTTGKIKTELQLVQSKQDRSVLLSHLPESAEGWTCIGCGLIEAMTVMDNGSPSACGDIIIFTDGQETNRPWVRQVHERVVKKKCTVNVIFFTTSANADLQRLVDATNGQWFFSNVADITRLISAFGKLASSNDGDLSTQTSVIHSEKYELAAGGVNSSDVDMDATIGRQTVFTFLWSSDSTPPTITITSPSGCRYSTDKALNVNMCSGQPISIVEDNLKRVRFPLPGISEKGKWRYRISSASKEVVTVSITTKPRTVNTAPIIVDGGMTKTDIKKQEGIVVYARVTRGGEPILGATVQAVVDRPDDTSFTVKLLDSGAAPDKTANDGIYSTYFIGYTIPGRYSLSFSVHGIGGNATNQTSIGLSAAYNPGFIRRNGSLVLNKNRDKNRPKTSETGAETDIGSFTRIVAVGGFSYSGRTISPGDDVFAPNRIHDLRVRQNDLTNSSRGVVLTFSAPGDDLNYGTASEYDIRFTFGDPETLLTPADGSQTLAGEKVTGLPLPLESGSAEDILLETPQLPVKKGIVKIAYVVRARDDVGKMAEASNIAVLNFYIDPPVLPSKKTANDGAEQLRWCRQSYRRAYRAAYWVACLSYQSRSQVASCAAASRQFYWTPSNYHFECGKLDYFSACQSAVRASCYDPYCYSCQSYSYRASYDLYSNY